MLCLKTSKIVSSSSSLSEYSAHYPEMFSCIILLSSVAGAVRDPLTAGGAHGFVPACSWHFWYRSQAFFFCFACECLWGAFHMLAEFLLEIVLGKGLVSLKKV